MYQPTPSPYSQNARDHPCLETDIGVANPEPLLMSVSETVIDLHGYICGGNMNEALSGSQRMHTTLHVIPDCGEGWQRFKQLPCIL